ncbi:MAG TPA: amidohydrolase family protein [Burkholderiales bacterium]|nr:amidohydrolase family protein [Burkholderiales bacterium]
MRRLAASALLCLACCVAGPSAGASELPIFDAHLHYSQDAWESVPPPEAIAILRKAGLGEFHLYGADADLPVPRRMVQLARRNKLFLHAHSDADAVERLFAQWPEARILWAHSGFERPEKVREMLRRHRNLWCDLAFRTDHARGGKVDPDWRAAFLEFPDRFLVGTDSFTPERWYYIGEHARWSRQWLADLPRDVAERIAWTNGETLVGGVAAQ